MEAGSRVRVKGRAGTIVLARPGSDRCKVAWDGGGASLILRKHVKPERVPVTAAHSLIADPDYERPEHSPQHKTPPLRSAAYLRFVRKQPCALCGTTERPREAHHTTKRGAGGMGLKGDDYRCVSLCRGCHDLTHHGRVEAQSLLLAQVDTLIAWIETSQ